MVRPRRFVPLAEGSRQLWSERPTARTLSRQPKVGDKTLVPQAIRLSSRGERTAQKQSHKVVALAFGCGNARNFTCHEKSPNHPESSLMHHVGGTNNPTSKRVVGIISRPREAHSSRSPAARGILLPGHVIAELLHQQDVSCDNGET